MGLSAESKISDFFQRNSLTRLFAEFSCNGLAAILQHPCRGVAEEFQKSHFNYNLLPSCWLPISENNKNLKTRFVTVVSCLSLQSQKPKLEYYGRRASKSALHAQVRLIR